MSTLVIHNADISDWATLSKRVFENSCLHITKQNIDKFYNYISPNYLVFTGIETLINTEQFILL